MLTGRDATMGNAAINLPLETEQGAMARKGWGEGGVDMLKRISEQKQKEKQTQAMKDTLDLDIKNITRQSNIFDLYTKTTDHLVKLTKDGSISPDIKSGMIDTLNNFTTKVGGTPIKIFDDAATIQKKYEDTAYKQFVFDPKKAFDEKPNELTFSHAMNMLEVYKQKFPQKDVALAQAALKDKMTDVQKVEAEGRAETSKIGAEGRAETRTIAGEKRRAKLGQEFPTPVTWTSADKSLRSRFGKQDAVGNIIITPDLAGVHRIAQKKLVELKKSGKTEPLDAVNKAEESARKIELGFWGFINDAKGDKDKIAKIRRAFAREHGYVPTVPPR